MQFPSKPCEASVVASLFSWGVPVHPEMEEIIIMMCAFGFPPQSIARNICRRDAWPRRKKTMRDAFPEYSFREEDFEAIREIYFEIGDCAKFAESIVNLIEKNSPSKIPMAKLKAANDRIYSWDELREAISVKFTSTPQAILDEVQFQYLAGLWEEADAFAFIQQNLAGTSKPGLV